MTDAAQKRIVSGDALAGRSFVVYNLGLPNKQYHYLYTYKSATERDAVSPLTLSQEDVSFDDGEQCVGTACSILIAWSGRELLEFDPKSGDLVAWWVEK